MNTANAAGYLLGALMTPTLMRRFGPMRLLVGGALWASLFMVASGFVTSAGALLLQRLLAGLASAWVFVAGGLLAARLGTLQPSRAGFLLGLYYGGTGLGIALSALLVPAVLQAAAGVSHGWAWAWWALALAQLPGSDCRVGHCAAMRAMPTQVHAQPATASPHTVPFESQRQVSRFEKLGAGTGYTLFGAGYIGYMTFVIALLRGAGREAGRSPCSALSRRSGLHGFNHGYGPGLLDRYKGDRKHFSMHCSVWPRCCRL